MESDVGGAPSREFGDSLFTESAVDLLELAPFPLEGAVNAMV